MTRTGSTGGTNSMTETYAPKHMVATGSGERPDDGRRRRDGKTVAVDVLITITLAAVMLAIGSMKQGFFLDEIATFKLANADASVARIEEGEVYSGSELWDLWTGVPEGGRFDYANVWANQAADVHPPLYYVLVHTLSSLFMGLDIKWIGLMVSIPLAIVAYWQYVWMCRRLGMHDWMALALPATFVLGACFMNSTVLLFRMYGLMTVWSNFLVMIFLRYAPDEHGSAAYFVSLFAALAGGILTQYYFLIYAFFACLVYAIAVAVARNWRKLLASLAVAAAAIAAAFLVFPAMYDHIFTGYRGQEAFENALSGGFWEMFSEYLYNLHVDLFAGLTLVVAVVLVALIVLTRKDGSPKMGSDTALGYCLMAVPALLYLLVVSKVSWAATIRYVISVCGLLYLSLFGIMAELADGLPKGSSPASAVVLLLSAAIMLWSYSDGVDFLYLEDDDAIDAIVAEDDADGIVVYDSDAAFHNHCKNLEYGSYMDDVAFLTEESVDGFDYGYIDSDSIFVFVDKDYDDGTADKVLESIMAGTGFTGCEYEFEIDYFYVYLLER